MRTKRILIAWFVLVSLSAGLTAPAYAAGPSTHLYATREAISKVEDPQLRSLLERNKSALMCGVSFPDFGTAIDYGTFHQKKLKYGSVAHNPPFVEAYLDYVQDKCGGDLASCDKLVAHFMGVAAHGMEDDLYDELFMNKAEALDPAGGKVKHDLWADEIFIVKYNPLDLVPAYYLPTKDLVEVYRELGLEVKPGELRLGKLYHWSGAAGLRSIALLPYPYYSRKMSFSRDNIVTHPGGVEHMIEVISRYFGILWDRLRGADALAKPILETWPHDGARDHEPDSGSLYSRVTVYFSTGMDQATLNQDSFYLTGPDGRRVRASYRTHVEKDNYTVLIPEEDLERGAIYSAVITTAAKDMRGQSLPESYSWSFTAAE